MKILRDKAGAAPPGGVQRAIGLAAVLFSLLGGSAASVAQEIRPFRIEDISGIVEAGFLTNLEERSRAQSSGSNFDRVELSQLLQLNADGYIYHPRFLTFDTGIKLEAIEGLYGPNGNRFLWGGNYRFNFLEQHRNSLSIYGTRLESELARPFSETYRITNELYGATFFQKWGWIPFDLSYQHGIRSGGVDNQLDDSSDRVIFDGRYRIAERSDGRLEYDLSFEEIQDRDIRRQNLAASNVSYLGEGNDKRWDTHLRLFEERDGDRRRNASGNTDFDWKHNDDLRTHYALNGRWSDSANQTATNLNSSFFLTHQLYESLTTDFEVFGNFEDASYRNRQEVGGRIAERYLKRLGNWGRLNVSVSPHTSMVYNRLGESTAFIFDESHLMIGLQPVLLLQPDIIASSIVVTDENGSIVYDQGLLGDYVVNQIGGGLQTELVRTPTSSIADGQLVLVDYEYVLPGDNDTLSTGVAVHTSLAFLDYWNVFGSYDNLDFHVLSGNKEELRLNSFDRYLAGLQFNSHWCSAKAEFEENDASITPSRRYSGSVSFFTDGAATWNGRMNGDYTHLIRGDSNQVVDRFSVSGSASKRFFKRGLLAADASWLSERWSGQSNRANDLDAVNVKLRYSWWYGKVEFKLETGFARLLRPTEDRSVYRADFRVRRVF